MMKKRPSRKELNRKITELERQAVVLKDKVQQLSNKQEFVKNVSEGTDKLYRLGLENPRAMTLYIMCLEANLEFSKNGTISEALLTKMIEFCKEES